MKKRILSVALSAAMTLGCFGGVPMALAAEAESAFNPDEHLIKVSDDRYQIISLDGTVTMNLFADARAQWSYSVDKNSLVETVETFVLGNADLDAEDKVDVADIMKMKNIIMTEQCTDRERLVANADRDEAGKVDVADIMVVKNAIMADKAIGTVDMVTGTTGEEATWVADSTLGIVIDNVTYFKRASVEKITVTETDRTYAHFGNQSELHDNGVAAEVEFKQGGQTYYLDIRVYNDGVAFRYRMPGEGARTVNDELTTFKLRSDLDAAWYGVNNRDYEAVIESHDPEVASNDRIVAPLTAVVSDGKGYIAVQEAGVGDVYGGTCLQAKGDATYKIRTTWDQNAETKNRSVTGEFATGWRMISLADDLNALVNNYNVYHVNEAADEELYADTSWIEPGRSGWSWLTDYGSSLATPDAMYQFTLNAARLGFEYNVIDEGYRNAGWGDSNATLADLGAYGDELGVKQLLWASYSAGHNGYRMTNVQEAEAYLDFLAANSLYGGKIDFWDSEENPVTNSLQHAIAEMAAARELIVNFHGCNKPGGISATYPNVLTREAIRGLENIGASANTNYTTQATWLTRQLFTRYLSGHADWTPACDIAMQIASLICIDSPLNVIATNPANILKNPAVEMIKSIPTVWDRTIVLSNSKIGGNAIYAKENGGVWYLGGIFAEATSTTVKLDEFLEDGSYMMEMWVDSTDAAGKTTMEKIEKTVTAADVIELADMAVGNGFAARLTKLALSQYGGEIIEPITITTVDADAVVKYTTDGSDPATSETAKTYTDGIVLTESCDLRVAIVEGDGAGTTIKANFNAITTPFIEESLETLEDKTVVSFKHNANGTVKYTTDGSDPATSATAKTYAGPFDVTKTCTVKAVVLTEGKDPVSTEFSVYVTIPDSAMVTPDLYLGKDYVSARTDWGSIHVNESMGGSGTKISLGGSTASNGTKYDRGISFNAVGEIVYNIPVGATQFVGVVGIDDRTWNSDGGEMASGTCTVSFDGTEAVTTPIFRRGDYYNILVDVPEGAKQITIHFGNAGDGNHCDNVAMGNAGWIMDKGQGNQVTYKLTELTGSSTLSFTMNFEGTLYYTTDGSEPTTGSQVYTGPLSFSADATVKVLAIPAKGGDNITLSVEVPVDEFELVPDVYLAKADLISSSTGWSGDPASIDKNTKGGTISLGGVEYAHGISTNSNGHFTFNIPANAVKFIAVAGVDDCTYDNVGDGHKASITVSISFDGGAAVYTSDVIRQGGFVAIELDVPAGAKQITINFGDAGIEGITCDNASMGNAGWILG